jgi:hypothetical protein
MERIIEALKDAVLAAAGVSAVEVGGVVTGASSWLIGLGQAVIVVAFTLHGIDRRLKGLSDAQDKLRGRLARLEGFIGLDEEEG